MCRPLADTQYFRNVFASPGNSETMTRLGSNVQLGQAFLAGGPGRVLDIVDPFGGSPPMPSNFGFLCTIASSCDCSPTIKTGPEGQPRNGSPMTGVRPGNSNDSAELQRKRSSCDCGEPRTCTRSHEDILWGLRGGTVFSVGETYFRSRCRLRRIRSMPNAWFKRLAEFQSEGHGGSHVKVPPSLWQHSVAQIPMSRTYVISDRPILQSSWARSSL